MAVARRRTWLDWMELAFLGAMVLLTILFAVSIAVTAGGDVTKCANAVPKSSPIGPVLAFIGLFGFTAGRGLAQIRKWIHQAPAVSDSKVVRTDAWLQGLLALFLALTALLLGYETFAVSPSGNVPPITEYVRCAAGAQPWLAGLATAAVSALLGNWLWYPTR